MKYFVFNKMVTIIPLVALFFFGSCSSLTFTENGGWDNFEPSSQSLNRCGGVIQSDSATINYKVSEQVLPNERCVWIIASPNATLFRIEADFDFLPDAGLLMIDGVNITSPSSLQSVNLSTDTLIEVAANVLIVTFHTPASIQSTGFSLTVQRAAMGAIINPASRYELFEHRTDLGLSILGHPQTPGNYVNNELSMFVFFPYNNIFANKTRNLTYKEVGLEQSCNDALYVYQFNSTGNEWGYDRRMCSGDDYITISGNDLILLLFTSNPSTTRGGFYLVEADLDC